MPEERWTRTTPDRNVIELRGRDTGDIPGVSQYKNVN
jgi:hypothetical protein